MAESMCYVCGDSLVDEDFATGRPKSASHQWQHSGSISADDIFNSDFTTKLVAPCDTHPVWMLIEHGWSAL